MQAFKYHYIITFFIYSWLYPLALWTVGVFLTTMVGMNKNKNNQNGFSVVELLIILVVVAVLGLVGWKVYSTKNKDSAKSTSSSSQSSGETTDEEPDTFIWQQTATGWQATETAPECPKQPMLKMPADLSKVTSLLYPGQTRGGNYKPHGGFRFDSSTDNAITVTAPISGYIVRGGSYHAEGTTEIQYTFDVMNNCGVMFRLGHLRELPTNLQKIADTWPAPTSSSATQNVNPPVYVKQGDVMANKVGLITEKNTFFDWGVYDYRSENEASKAQAYQAAHPQPELAWHAVCWFQDGWLQSSDQTTLAGLKPGDPASAKKSDYCK